MNIETMKKLVQGFIPHQFFLYSEEIGDSGCLFL